MSDEILHIREMFNVTTTHPIDIFDKDQTVGKNVHFDNLKNVSENGEFIASYPFFSKRHVAELHRGESMYLGPIFDPASGTTKSRIENDSYSATLKVPGIYVPKHVRELAEKEETTVNTREVESITDLAKTIGDVPLATIEDFSSVGLPVDLLQPKTFKTDDVDLEVEEISIETLTERSVDGHGAFDWIATAVQQQISSAINREIINKSEARDVFTTGLQHSLETAVSFVLENSKTLWANRAVKAQLKETNARIAQIELQSSLAEMQIQAAAWEAKLKDAQIRETNARIAQIEEQTALVNVQIQAAVWDTKLKDAQLKQIEAGIRIQAQQLLKELKHTGLLNAQTAAAYANIAAMVEQVKAAKAQYSDTINGKPVGGLLGAQMNVNKNQAIAFERDGFHKYFSAMSQGWGTKKTADIGIKSPAAFTGLAIDRLANWYGKTYYNLPTDMYELGNYSDAYSDEEFDTKFQPIKAAPSNKSGSK